MIRQDANPDTFTKRLLELAETRHQKEVRYVVGAGNHYLLHCRSVGCLLGGRMEDAKSGDDGIAKVTASFG